MDVHLKKEEEDVQQDAAAAAAAAVAVADDLLLVHPGAGERGESGRRPPRSGRQRDEAGRPAQGQGRGHHHLHKVGRKTLVDLPTNIASVNLVMGCAVRFFFFLTIPTRAVAY